MSRSFTCARVLAGLLAMVLAMVTAPAAAAPVDPSTAKIERQVLNALAATDIADYWVMFGQQADLSGAAAIKDWSARGAAVVEALRQTADASQARVRAQLDAQKVSYQSFFIANAIRVTGGSSTLARSLAQRGEVASIVAPREYGIPQPIPGKNARAVNAVEWGLAAINADDVWSQFGVRGEGVTVATIDSGVDLNHPALVGKYRGNFGDGTFDHNYNWFDPTGACGNPSTAPCDNTGHGTHTMGTMVGDDGAGNQIGVAPNARWIAAKGCESSGCSETALLRSGEWLLAPTDLSGSNPRPELRPDVVNNSWGLSNGHEVNPFYKSIVRAWRASGIFPAFAIGNSGSACDTSASPGDYTDTYSAGAFDIGGNIAEFSSRGPGESGRFKPNVSAPGVDVRSAWPGGGYESHSGTSMASPHLAGTVALVMSAAPALIGEVHVIETVLNRAAVDVPDLACGGTEGANNVWGEGKLDALAAVTGSPRRPTGTLTGRVFDTRTGQGVAGARVHLAGPLARDLFTDVSGRFTATLLAGDYTGTATKFGFSIATGTATVADGQTATLDLALSAVDTAAVSGRVRDSRAAPVGNATVQILGTPLSTTSAVDGSYSFPSVPLGTYQVLVQVHGNGGACFVPHTTALNVAADVTLDLTAADKRDRFGNICFLEAEPFVAADTPVNLAGDAELAEITLPFDFSFYGHVYRTAYLTTNGTMSFLNPIVVTAANGSIPATGPPNAAIYPFWNNLVVGPDSGVLTRLVGQAPNREFIVEWRNVRLFRAPLNVRVDFEVVLSESGDISLRYRDLDPTFFDQELGRSATVGIENETGTDALQYSYNSPTLSNEQSITFRPPPRVVVAPGVLDG